MKSASRSSSEAGSFPRVDRDAQDQNSFPQELSSWSVGVMDSDLPHLLFWFSFIFPIQAAWCSACYESSVLTWGWTRSNLHSHKASVMSWRNVPDTMLSGKVRTQNCVVSITIKYKYRIFFFKHRRDIPKMLIVISEWWDYGWFLFSFLCCPLFLRFSTKTMCYFYSHRETWCVLNGEYG